MTKEFGYFNKGGVNVREDDEAACETHAERMVVRRWRQNGRKVTHRIRLQSRWTGDRLRALRRRQTHEALQDNAVPTFNVYEW